MSNHVEDILNSEADEKLNKEVAQKEILDFLEEKYGVKYLVTQRTIQRWLKDLGIECIKPKPKRNSDIRYYKEDILKLEKMKRVNLLKKRNKELKRDEISKVGNELKENYLKGTQEYYENQAIMTHEELRQQDREEMLDYSLPALKQIKDDMLDMCFNKLFPDISFDKEMLEEILLTVNNPNMYSKEEVGRAFVDLTEKAYIKNYRE